VLTRLRVQQLFPAEQAGLVPVRKRNDAALEPPLICIAGNLKSSVVRPPGNAVDLSIRIGARLDRIQAAFAPLLDVAVQILEGRESKILTSNSARVSIRRPSRTGTSANR
jgi:hypothetical protein